MKKLNLDNINKLFAAFNEYFYTGDDSDKEYYLGLHKKYKNDLKKLTQEMKKETWISVDDKKIEYLVNVLNIKGMSTVSSCSGHREHEPFITIDLWKIKDIDKVVKTWLDDGGNEFDIYLDLFVDEGSRASEYVFPYFFHGSACLKERIHLNVRLDFHVDESELDDLATIFNIIYFKNLNKKKTKYC